MSTIDANNKNDYNNCTYDSEEDNYFRKSYSNTLYLRTFNNFHRNPKIRIIKNKTLKKYKIKHPSLTKSLKQKTKNSIFNPSYSLLENEQKLKDNTLSDMDSYNIEQEANLSTNLGGSSNEEDSSKNSFIHKSFLYKT